MNPITNDKKTFLKYMSSNISLANCSRDTLSLGSYLHLITLKSHFLFSSDPLHLSHHRCSSKSHLREWQQQICAPRAHPSRETCSKMSKTVRINFVRIPEKSQRFISNKAKSESKKRKWEDGRSTLQHFYCKLSGSANKFYCKLFTQLSGSAVILVTTALIPSVELRSLAA